METTWLQSCCRRQALPQQPTYTAWVPRCTSVQQVRAELQVRWCSVMNNTWQYTQPILCHRELLPACWSLVACKRYTV